MSGYKYEIVEIGRDADYRPRYNLVRDDTIILRDVLFPTAIEHVYEAMREGDTYEELYLDGSTSGLITYAHMSKSPSKKIYEEQKRKGR